MSRGEAVYEVLRHVRPLVLESTRVVESRVAPLGWTVGSRAVVELLAARGASTVPQLAGLLSLARQNVQRLVDGLRELGHVRVVENPAHRRSVLIDLTPAGHGAFARLHDQELDELATLAPEIGVRDLATAARVLAALERDVRDRAR
ncbi:MarR family winged helix-turn-helix transcriptional regulator [Nocardioides caldifontis]|uniref:MarR family winged helix-turn-helix transcriptional regulator n=1 Tax=Nocardioides caldifontis TaxID=2588938 RepID=UPI0011DFEF6D|nr:MarR family transcriptional regulator [Nocardioides caldifontis]